MDARVGGRCAAGAHQDKGDRAIAGVGVHSAGHGFAVGDGHHQVAEDEVGAHGLKGGNALLAVIGHVDAVALILQNGAEDLRDDALIFDYEDGFQNVIPRRLDRVGWSDGSPGFRVVGKHGWQSSLVSGCSVSPVLISFQYRRGSS